MLQKEVNPSNQRNTGLRKTELKGVEERKVPKVVGKGITFKGRPAQDGPMETMAQV